MTGVLGNNSILTHRDFYNLHKSVWSEQFSRIEGGNAFAAQFASDQMRNLFAFGMGATGYDGDTINKALSATGVIAVEGTTGGDALKLQDLTKQLAVAELNVKHHAPLWNWLAKVPTFSDVVELTRLDKYGGFRRGGFLDEGRCDGGLVATDPSITRKTTPVKWAGGRYMVSRTALALKTLGFNGDPLTGNVEEVASQAKLRQLILNLNDMSWHGDNSVNPHEPNGVLKQIRDAHTYERPTRINLKGQAITVDTMGQIEQVLRSKGGMWTDFWWSTRAFADMRRQLQNFVRIQSGQPTLLGNFAQEYLVEQWGGEAGRSKFHTDLMLDPPTNDDRFPAMVSGPTRPSAVTTQAVTDAAGNVWGEKLPAGAYSYSVASIGVNGRSNVRPNASGVVTDGTNRVEITITNGDANTIFFEVYRGDNAFNRQYLGRVSAYGLANGDTTVFVDNGEFVPGCSTACAMSNNQNPDGGAEVMIRQLYPISKVVLPINVMCIEAAWITAFTPQVMTPSFDLVLENVGRIAASYNSYGVLA